MKSDKVYYFMLISLVIFSFFSCSSNKKQNIETMVIKKKVFEIVIPAFGELEAVKSTSISVPHNIRGSQIISWMVPENSKVKKGSIVVRLSKTYYLEKIKKEEYQVAKINLDIEKKKYELEKEKKELSHQLDVIASEKEMAKKYRKRDKVLYSRNQIIDDSTDFDFLQKKTKHLLKKKKELEKKTKAEIGLLDSKKNRRVARLKKYKDIINSLDIKVPHDGLFLYAKNWRGDKPEIGKNVWRGFKLGKLPDLKDMKTKLHVLESEASGLKKGLPVAIYLDSYPGFKYYGKVINMVKIAKNLDKESPLKYFEVNVSLEKTDRKVMKPGCQVKAFISVLKKDAVISVPNQALFFEQEKSFINIKKDNKIVRRNVEIGERSLTRTIIKNGLTEGEEIILSEINPEDEI